MPLRPTIAKGFAVGGALGVGSLVEGYNFPPTVSAILELITGIDDPESRRPVKVCFCRSNGFRIANWRPRVPAVCTELYAHNFSCAKYVNGVVGR
jgi:hypothetical protein